MNLLYAFLHPAYAFLSRGLFLFAGRGYGYHIAAHSFGQSQYLVYHHLEVRPEVPEEVYQYQTVGSSVWVIAYGDERPCREVFQVQSAYGVFDSEFLKHSFCEIGSFLGAAFSVCVVKLFKFGHSFDRTYNSRTPLCLEKGGYATYLFVSV